MINGGAERTRRTELPIEQPECLGLPSRERTQAMLAAYRGGKATLVEVLSARRAEAEARLQSVEKERDVARMWARLEFMLPRTLPSAPRSTRLTENAP